MNSKRPYTHILKNLFHEQATEIIPLLMPGYRVEQVLHIEMPDLKSTYIEGQPDLFGQGLVQLVLPGAQVLGMYKTEWIEHSGKFERAYRVQDPTFDRSTYLVIEFQTEREDKMLPRRLLLTHLRTDSYVDNDTEQDNDDEQDKDSFELDDIVEQDNDDEPNDDDAQQDDDEQRHKGTSKRTYVYPVALSPFPTSAPVPIQDSLFGKPTMSFNFKVLGLWEMDAREMLNTHVSAIYFLLPAMKNANVSLLGLAIEELAQRFQHDDRELGRHLSGLHLMLHQSETMSEEEKVAAQEYLKRFAYLIKDDPNEE